MKVHPDSVVPTQQPPVSEVTEVVPMGAVSTNSLSTEEEKDPLKLVPGNAVQIFGLQSEKGKHMNGKFGKVLEFVEDTQRWNIKVVGGANMQIKRENLRLVEGSMKSLKSRNSEVSVQSTATIEALKEKLDRSTLRKEDFNTYEVMSAKYALENQKEPPKLLTKAKDAGIISDRTAADYLTDSANVNPVAVEQMGTRVLFEFRRKVFVMTIAQTIFVWLLSACFGHVFAYLEVPVWVGFIMALVALVILVITAMVRYSYPHNMIFLFIFSIFISLSFAILFGRNVLYGLLGVTVGMIIISVFGCIRFKKGMYEIRPIAVWVSILCAIVVSVYYFMYLSHIFWFYWILLLILNTFALNWFGHIMDRFSARLEAEAWVMPLVLTWAEIVPAMLFFAMCTCACACGDVTGAAEFANSLCNCCTGSTYCYAYACCNCYIHPDGTHSMHRDEENPEDEPTSPPPQEEMA